MPFLSVLLKSAPDLFPTLLSECQTSCQKSWLQVAPPKSKLLPKLLADSFDDLSVSASLLGGHTDYS